MTEKPQVEDLCGLKTATIDELVAELGSRSFAAIVAISPKTTGASLLRLHGSRLMCQGLLSDLDLMISQNQCRALDGSE